MKKNINIYYYIFFTLIFIITFIITFFLFYVNFLNNYETFIVTKNKKIQELEYGKSYSSKIPNIIWTFWEGDQNLFISNCIESWKYYNPDYDIHVLSISNCSKFIDIDISKIKHSKDSMARFSDYIRLLVLKKYGGIWIDASTICHCPFTWIHGIQNTTNCDLIGYYLDAFTINKFIETSPVIESWFFACIPNSIFVNDWCNEFLRTANYDNINDYIQNIKTDGIDLQNINDPYYLTIHASAQKIMQTNIDKYNIILFSACSGPYYYLCSSEWNSEKAIDKLLSEYTREEYYNFPIIKFRRVERVFITANNIDFIGMFSNQGNRRFSYYDTN